jgi:pectate lyase
MIVLPNRPGSSFTWMRILCCSLVILLLGIASGGMTQPIAFPGAEGFGKYTTGGRGGEVMIVSNLNDAGPGSFREAVEAKQPRIVVFTVSGTIRLSSPVSIRGDVTIAGQSAPGDGICLADHPVSVTGDNVIIRYLRFRMGDRYQDKGKVHGSGHDDALSSSRRKRLIIDHCSISWSTDECMSVYGGDSTTLQWNIISEPLDYSYHFEKGDTDYEHHGYGGIWGGAHLSAHHNLFAHCVSRTPRFNGTRLGATMERVDFRNNLVYDWGGNNVYGGEGGEYNIVGNYYKPGPTTSKRVAGRIVNPTRNQEVPFGRFYVAGNYVEGAPAVTSDNALGVQVTGTTDPQEIAGVSVSTPFPVLDLPVRSAEQAMKDILAHGGCSLPQRDTLDLRILRELGDRTGRVIDVQGGYPHGTPFEQTLTAWPILKSLPAPTDTDRDGMPDAWERKHGLNPKDPSDASRQPAGSSYTHIERYLNSLVK